MQFYPNIRPAEEHDFYEFNGFRDINDVYGFYLVCNGAWPETDAWYNF
jgi:hypothetical protein